MLDLDSTADAQIATRVAGAHWLIEFQFVSLTTLLTTAPVDVVTTSYGTFTSAPAISIESVRESEDAGSQQITLSIPITDSINLAAFVGPASEYRNQKVKLYLQLFDATFQRVGAPKFRGSWRMQPVRVSRQARKDGSSSGKVSLPCTRSGWEHARNRRGARHTHQQQLLRFPGDLGLQYLQALIEHPVLWLSKRFQELPG